MDFSSLADRLLCLLFPPRCALCGRVVEYEDLTCHGCAVEHPGPVTRTLPGGPLTVYSAMKYQSPAREAILRLKQQKDLRTARFFALSMADVMKDCCSGQKPDLLAPVPASPARYREKGFNHAELLARELGRLLELPVAPGLLIRSEASLAQHGLSAEDRYRNARATYSCAPGTELTGRTVLLVDDIVTTGATLSACAIRLSGTGASCVLAVTAAHTEKRD